MIIPLFTLTHQDGIVEDVCYFETRYSLRGPATEYSAVYYETNETSDEITLAPGEEVKITLVRFTTT